MSNNKNEKKNKFRKKKPRKQIKVIPSLSLKLVT